MPECFVIMPFGAVGSPERKRYDGVYEYIIKRAVTAAGFVCTRADDIPDMGPIPMQIKAELAVADLVVADLSGSNPNVFYELGYRHAKGKHCIPIADSDSIRRLPFDVSSYRTVSYELSDPGTWVQCADKIQTNARQIFDDLASSQLETGETGSASAETTHRFQSTLSLSLANISGSLSELLSMKPTWSEPATKINELSRQMDRLEQKLHTMSGQFLQLQDAPRIVSDTVGAGLIGIYFSRPEAIEQQMYRHLVDEEKGISIVGSTLYGLRGTNVTTQKILGSLKLKAKQDNFKLRILLTHWDNISSRQAQEKAAKTWARLLISQELLKAVRDLREMGLSDSVRFYRGAPTCSSIFCEGQQIMLVNPYPYQSEAINSWAAVFRGGRIYEEFKKAHIDDPWDNRELAVKCDEKAERAIENKVGEDWNSMQTSQIPSQNVTQGDPQGKMDPSP